MKIAWQYKSSLLVMCVILAASVVVQAKSKYACDEPDPASLCNAANTCGSATAPCTVNVNKSGNASTVKPGVPNAKDNQLFCIKKGTQVIWMTSNKNTGFMISFGTDNPVEPDNPIIGGANKQITVKANTPGCYKYDAGAFYSGATYGMSGGSKPEFVILP